VLLTEGIGNPEAVDGRGECTPLVFTGRTLKEEA
jgi:hypothetical protein